MQTVNCSASVCVEMQIKLKGFEMKLIQPHDWPRPKGYANAIAAKGEILFISGQVGWNPLTGTFERADFISQVKQALTNIVTVLAEAGGRAEDIVRFTWYITDRGAYIAGRKEIGSVYRAVMGNHYPAMSVVVVSGLIEDRALVEIEATAMLSR